MTLKPFAMGAVVVAALTVVVFSRASLLGGDHTLPVVDSSGSTTAESIEDPADVSTPASAPSVSSQDVYLDAEATAETYVSVMADGIVIFEGIMQPGDTMLWEAEEIIDVYSGNAGALTIGANGKPGEVLGEDGRLGQKIFEAQ